MPLAMNLQVSYWGSDIKVFNLMSLEKNSNPGALIVGFNSSSLKCFMFEHSNKK